MKKLIILLLIFFSSGVFAIENETQNTPYEININTKYEAKKNLPIVIQSPNTKKAQKDIKHLPWSMTERRIEYDSNGRPIYAPYTLTDLNLQY